ncbi:glycosyltransferase [Geobacter sulfurreducens]|nr:glycosyltransferase [Geobacter sulfurreducens]
MKSERRWLILSYFSRIDGMACAQHIDDRLPYFEKNGISPVLLTSICGTCHEGVIQKRVPSVAPSGIRYELRHLRKRSAWVKMIAPLINVILLPFYLIEKLIIDLDSQWSWFPLAIMRGISLCRRYRPEVIYSTGGPASAHVAAALISRTTGIPFIAEFQDPLVHGDWLRSRRALRVFTWLERFICERASAVIFLTDEARKNAQSRTNLGAKGHVIYPGANPFDLSGPLRHKGEFCRFSHFGSLGGSRNLVVFLEALRLVFSEHPELAEVIRLDLYGSCDGRSRRSIEEFPWPQVVQDHGRIPRTESLAVMRRTDVLLLIQNTEEFSAETIPSKVYEYFHAARPILGLVHHNQELREMLEARGDRPVSADDPRDVSAGIVHYVQLWRLSDLTISKACTHYDVSSAVDRLVQINREGFSAPLRANLGAMAKVSIIIVSYNSLHETTAPCLESIFSRTDYDNYEVIVVDNASKDGTPDYLRQLAAREKRLVCILNETNRGFAGGNNDAIKAATGDVLVLLNSDTVVTRGWLAKLVEPLRDKSIGMVGPVTNSVGNEQRIFSAGATVEEILAEGERWTDTADSGLFETERLGFFCVAFRREVTERIGLLDEGFGLGFYEDDDYCIRVRKAGYRIVCREDVFVYHRGGGSFGKMSATARALIKRNRQLLEAKHGITYRPRHPRDRQLDLAEQYLQGFAGGGDEFLLHKCHGRLKVAETSVPRGYVKRLLFRRRMRALQNVLLRYDAALAKGGEGVTKGKNGR